LAIGLQLEIFPMPLSRPVSTRLALFDLGYGVGIFALIGR
jgi:hypothetical protein